MLPAALVLAIMVLPTVTAISRDALVAVPPELREAAFGLGATRWETILASSCRRRRRGIFGSIVLGLRPGPRRDDGPGHAGRQRQQSSAWSLFSPANTLAALLANKFPEAGRRWRWAR